MSRALFLNIFLQPKKELKINSFSKKNSSKLTLYLKKINFGITISKNKILKRYGYISKLRDI